MEDRMMATTAWTVYDMPTAHQALLAMAYAAGPRSTQNALDTIQSSPEQVPALEVSRAPRQNPPRMHIAGDAALAFVIVDDGILLLGGGPFPSRVADAATRAWAELPRVGDHFGRPTMEGAQPQPCFVIGTPARGIDSMALPRVQAELTQHATSWQSAPTFDPHVVTLPITQWTRAFGVRLALERVALLLIAIGTVGADAEEELARRLRTRATALERFAARELRERS
jgi:hypothetical protein